MGDPRRDRDALVEAGMALASELSLAAVLQKIVTIACDVADARYGALGVLGPSGAIQDFVTHGVTEEERRRIGHLPVGKGILGVLIREARPLRLRRIQDDERSVGFPRNHPPMTSFLGVPIISRGHVYGNLYLTEKRGSGEFSEEDQEAVVILASQAGVAIENARLYQETTVNQRRLEAVNQVATAILGGEAIDEVLTLLTSHARHLVGGESSSVSTPEEGGESLTVRVATGWGADQMAGVRYPTEGSISADVMATGRPLLVEDASADPRVSQPIVRIGGIGPAAFVPLQAGERRIGTLMVANRSGGRLFTDADVRILEVFAAQAAVALDYARIRVELERLAVLEDRERIAKELHDGVVQALFAVGMGLQAAEAASDEGAVKDRIASAVDGIDAAIRDLRNYIFGLRPGSLADRQVERALAELVAGFGDSAPRIKVHVESAAAALLAGRAADLLQAAREALSNAVRHSGAERIELALRRDGRDVVLEVTDTGRGFVFAEARRRGGHGLANLEERAAALGGVLEVESSPGEGTTVRLRIPG